MKSPNRAPGIVLDRGRMLHLDQAEGTRVINQHGVLWITQDGDPRDVVLRAGESFDLDRGTPTIVQALETATVLILEPMAPRPRSVVGRVRRAAAAIRRYVMAPAVRRHPLVLVER